MRMMMWACAMLLPIAAAAQDLPPAGSQPAGQPGGHHGGPGHGGPGPRGGGRLFISPMGEPFRSVKGGPEPQDLWFAAADTNHDNALTRAEFQADAMRFFQILDRQHDGEIDPEDLEYYETVMAPEIRVAAGGYGGIESGGGGDGEQSSSQPVYPDRQGAARYGYFSFPEPITAADTNFNRGVSVEEFRKAADSRFDVLDTNGDGKIDHAELPKIAPPGVEGRRGGGRGGGSGGGRGHGGGGGHHGGGGMGGGGMGGGGMGGGGMNDPGG